MSPRTEASGDGELDRRRRRARLTALLVGGVAVVVYLIFWFVNGILR